MQDHGRGNQRDAYMSETLTSAQLNYSIYEIELLAMSVAAST